MRKLILLIVLIIFVSCCVQQTPIVQETPNKTEEIPNVTEEVQEIPLVLKNFELYDYKNITVNITLNISFPLLYDNIRWPQMPILVKIDTSNCDEPSFILNQTRIAFDIWKNETAGIISFEEVEDDQQVTVNCTREMPRGEYGDVGLAYALPTEVLSTNFFSLADEGLVSIFLLEKRCKPLTIIHELGHVLGLGHSIQPSSIMYYEFNDLCSSVFTDDIKDTLKELYKTTPLPDLYFINASAVSFGSLNVSFGIKNGGLLPSPSVDVEIRDNQTKIASYILDPLKAGWYFESITVNDIKIKKPVDEIRIIIDPENLIEEFDEGNNEIILKTD